VLIDSCISFPTQLNSLEKICDYEAIHRFAVLSDDFNPIHVDREFAAASPMGGIIAHGPMSLGLLFQAVRSSLHEQHAQHIAVDVRFRRPVRENDRITAGGELRAGHENTYDVWVKNQKGEVVVEGEVRVASPDARGKPR
jgi:3-hydroxybutyryl-CoA dehydratase